MLRDLRPATRVLKRLTVLANDWPPYLKAHWPGPLPYATPWFYGRAYSQHEEGEFKLHERILVINERVISGAGHYKILPDL